MAYSRKIKEKVKRRLYACSGNCCEMYGCRQQLLDMNGTNYGEICHIEAVNEGGARYNANCSDEYINSFDNLLLLCPTHHKEVDDINNLNKYTVEFLKQMKRQHENHILNSSSNNNIVDPLLWLENFNFNIIIEKYEMEFNGEIITKEEIYNYLIELFWLNEKIRLVIYFLIREVLKQNSLAINVDILFSYTNIGYDNFAYFINIVEKKKYIEEIILSKDPLSGFEDADGYWVLLNSNIKYRKKNGLWQLRKRGKLLLIIRLLLHEQLFYQFIVRRAPIDLTKSENGDYQI